MTNQTIEQAVERFGNQFDELKMKSPKNSMPGLERELLKDFMRKALQAQRDAGAEYGRQVLITAMGMQAENMQRQALGQSMAYTEEDFLALTPPTK